MKKDNMSSVTKFLYDTAVILYYDRNLGVRKYGNYFKKCENDDS